MAGTPTELTDFLSAVRNITNALKGSVSPLNAVISALQQNVKGGGSGGGLGVLGGLSGGAVAVAAGVGAAVAMVKDMVSRAKDGFETVLQTLANGFSRMKSIVLETVEAFRPFEVEMFNRAVKDLKAVFGTIFLPILHEVTKMVRSLADAIYSLPQPFKDTIALVAKLTLILGGLTIVFGAFAAVGATLAAIIAPFVIVLTGFGILLGPLIITVVGGIGSLTASLIGFAGALVALNFSRIVRAVEQIWYTLETVVQAVWEQLKPVWAELKAAFAMLGDELAKLWDALKPLIGGFILLIANGIKLGLQLIIQGLIFFVNALTNIVQWVNKLVQRLGLPGFNLPEVPVAPASAQGLGQHGGSVTDPLAAFRAAQEEVLRFSPKETDRPEKRIAEIQQDTKNMANNLQIIAQIAQGAVNQIPNEGMEILKKGPVRWLWGKAF